MRLFRMEDSNALRVEGTQQEFIHLARELLRQAECSDSVFDGIVSDVTHFVNDERSDLPGKMYFRRIRTT